MYTRRMLVDRHLEAGTPVPQVRIKIDAEIILRHHLDLALEATRNYAVSRLPSAVTTIRRRFRLSQLAHLARSIADDLGRQLARQARRRRVGPDGEGKNVEVCERQ